MTVTMEVPTTVQQKPCETAPPSRAGSWIEVLPHFDPKFGGMSAVVPQLASTLVESENCVVNLAAFCPPDETAAVALARGISLTTWPSGRLTWLRDRSVRRAFRELLSSADGLHIHGLWEASTSVSARTARKLGKPYILSAHGMLEPWALANKSLKKALYSALVERANVEGAACLHALTLDEAEDYRRFGGRRPIAVIPNGVELPRAADEGLFLEQFAGLRGKRIVLFLGRIHFKKGLDLLVDAWAALASSFPDAVLVMAGPDAEDSQAAVEREIRRHNIEDRVVFTGMLGTDMKWSALAAATCFVLPSYSEGLSVAALEAMGMGLPVILTTHCHLPEVAECDAGFIIPADLLELHSALETVLSASDRSNAEMGRRGARLVQERFSRSIVARQMAELYRWVLGGPLPENVKLLGASA